MKGRLLHLFATVSMLCFFSIGASAQTILSQDWSSTTFPPTGWTRSIGSGSYNWQRTTTGITNPTGVTPYSSPGMAGFNSWNASSGYNATLFSPSMNFSSYGSTGSNQVTVSWYKYGSVSSYTDYITLYVNTSASLSGATTLGTLYESLLSSPTASTAGWYSYTYSIPASFASSTSVYLMIKATSAYGYDMLMDDITVTHIPPCSGTPTVSIGKLPYVCSGKTFTLTATVPTASGMLYQWQQATSATGPWSNISGATTTSYTGSISSTTYFRFKDSCTASGNTGISNVDTVAIAPAALCPCDVQYYYPLYSSTTPSCSYTINSFTITGDAPSSFTDGSIPCVLSTYSLYDRTFDTVKMTQTGTYSGSLSFGLTTYCGYAIWIDFNDDGTFQAAERLVQNTTYSTAFSSPSTFSLTIPGTAAVGPHRMRVRWAYVSSGGPSTGLHPGFYNDIDPCTYQTTGSGTDNYYYGSARDFVANIQAAPLCTGTPSVTISTVPAVCSGGTVTLTATPSPKLALGYFYQWQQASSPTGPWTNIASASNTTYTSGPITAATYFRCQVLCSNSGFTGTSNVDTTVLKAAALCPCTVLYYYGTPGYTSGTACTYNISNFTITAVNTITEGTLTCVANSNGYYDRTVIAADTITMYPGGNYNGSITTSYGYYVAVQIWIDYNDDGTFATTEAQMPTMMNGAYISKTSYPYRLYIPTNAPLGPHRMRVRYAYTGNYTGPNIWTSMYANYIFDPCNYTYTNTGGTSYYYYGSTRDYEVKIITPPTVCTGVPSAATITPAGPQSICAGLRDTLYMTSAIQAGYNYQWQSSTDGGSTWNNIAGATGTMYTFVVSSSAWYRINVTCSNSGLSTPSNIVIVNLAPAINCPCNSPSSLQYYYEYLYGYNPCSSYYISRVQVAGATTMNDVYSTCLGWGYEDRTAVTTPANILQGGTATWTLGFSGSSTLYRCTIWIDYNDDGTFASTEVVDYFYVNSTTVTRPAVTIPATAPTGIHRMRVRFCYTSSTVVSPLDPCAYSNPSGSYNYYGDAHDYYVNVISNTPTPTLSPNTTQNLCVGNTISITATTTATGPTFTYNWTGPNGYTSSTTTTSTTNTITIPSAAFVNSGPYYCRVISSSAPGAASAPAIDSVFVWPYPNIVAGTVTSNSPVCTPNPITLNGIGNPNNITYSWTGPNSFTSTSPTPTIGSSTTAMGGTYTITLNNHGCTTTGSTNVTVYQTPSIVSTSKVDPTTCTCNCGSITLTGLNASTTYTVNYLRNGIAATPISRTTDASGNLVMNGLNAAIYDKINVTLNGCPSANVGPISLVNPSVPPTPTVSSNSPVCISSPLTFSGSVATSLTWTWSGPGGYTYSNTGTTSAPTKTTSAVFADSGNYYVYVTDGAGCTGPVQVLNVVVKPAPNTPTVLINNAALPGGLCQGQTLTLSMTTATPPGTPGGITYTWTDPRGSTTNPSTSATYSSTGTVSVSNITNDFAGNWTVYSVLNGCSSAAPATVYTYIKWTPGTPTLSSNSPVCAGAGYNTNNIILTAGDTTTSPLLTYTWSGPNGYSAAGTTSNTQSITSPPVSASGTYAVYASLLGCNSPSVTTTVTVNPTPGRPSVSPTFTTYCQKDAAIPLTATGTNLLWHTASTGSVGSSSAPTPSTLTAGLFFWYVTQTTNYTGVSCESPAAIDTVLVKTKPPYPYGVSAYTYCQGDNATLLSAIGANLLWYTSASGGLGSPVPPLPSTATPSVTIYYVTQTINGCESDRYAITVTVKAKPPKPGVGVKEYCQNDFALPLTAPGSNLMWYRTSSGGVGSPIAPTPVTSYADTSYYYVTQTVNGCESDRAELLVVVNYTPNALIVANEPYVCQYDSTFFTYYGNALPSASYNWAMPTGATLLHTSGPQGPIWVKFDSAGKRIVTLQVTNKKCKSPVTNYIVDVKPAPLAPTNIASEVCQDNIMDVSLGYANQHIDKYDWNFDGAEVVYGSEGGGPFGIRWHTPGEHIVKFVAYTATCPSIPQYDTVIVHPLADAHIGDVSNTAICSGDSVQFTAERYNPAYLYQWNPAIYFGTQTNKGTVYGFIEHTGYVQLKVTTEYGCTSTDSTLITAQPCCDVYFPNAFTPNGDGKNDVFRPISKGNQVIKTFRISNRWGQIMFETVNPRIGWDGKFNGTLQDLGTYYYFIRYLCANGKVYEEKGEVLLIK